MATLVVSDLHLGAVLGGDVLRHEEPRRRLLAEVEGCERVVLLGDVLELREQPIAAVLEAAYPFFEELDDALGGGEVVIVPGNHDHQLAATLIEARRLQHPPEPLRIEQLSGPDGPAAAAIARRMPHSELRIAYPGLWLRPDVYATHGHYLDCHLEIPRLEVLGIAATRRILGRDLDQRAPDDYEAVMAPLYAFAYHLAHATQPGGKAVGSDISARVWTRLNARPPSIRSRLAAGVAIPAIVGLLNRAGLGPFRADLSAQALRNAGVRAMGTVVAGLGVRAAHVLFGHTHRPGPLPGDEEWRAPGGARLHNTGSWVYERALVSRRGPESAYWPGTVTLVPDEGPPELRRVLADLEPAAFAPAR